MNLLNNTTVQKYKSLVMQEGKSSLHAKYPTEFELYVCALELVDSKGQTVDYFVFPIMPNSIHEDDKAVMQIKKTAGGIITISTDTYTPRTISLQGSFGRKFKILIGRKNITGSAFQYSTANGKFTKESILSGAVQSKTALFDSSIKTGFGCLKILEAMYDKSRTVDQDGNPFRLYFYNLANGNHYLVRATDFNHFQDMANNMIWNYTLSLEALAPLSGVVDDTVSSGSLTKAMQYSNLSQASDITAHALNDFVF